MLDRELGDGHAARLSDVDESRAFFMTKKEAPPKSLAEPGFLILLR